MPLLYLTFFQKFNVTHSQTIFQELPDYKHALLIHNNCQLLLLRNYVDDE